MRNINNVEVAAVSGGLNASEASSLAGAFMFKDVFAFNYSVAGYDLGAALATAGGVVVGSVVGRFVEHVVSTHVYPVTDSVNV